MWQETHGKVWITRTCGLPPCRVLGGELCPAHGRVGGLGGSVKRSGFGVREREDLGSAQCGGLRDSIDEGGWGPANGAVGRCEEGVGLRAGQGRRRRKNTRGSMRPT